MKEMNLEIENPAARLSGHFKLEVINPSTGAVKRSLEFDNLILNNGLNRFTATSITTTSAMNRICIGTGTIAPDVNQTALQSFSASTIATSANVYQSSTNSLNGTLYSVTSTRLRFLVGTLNGNYSEIGAGWSDTQLFSRALILDVNGNPTTITVLSDEALDVTYTLRMYIPQTDFNTSVTITGVGTDIPLTIRPAIVRVGHSTSASTTNIGNTPWQTGASGWTLADGTQGVMQSAAGTSSLNTSAGAVTGSGANIAFSPTTSTTLQSMTYTSYTRAGTVNAATDVVGSASTYVTNNFYKDVTLFTNLNSYNATYRHFVLAFNSFGTYQYLLDTPITKTNTQVLTLNFRCSWARKTI